jgi:hypothetical protein
VFPIENIKFEIFRRFEFFFNFILQKAIEILFLIMFIASLSTLSLKSHSSIFKSLYNFHIPAKMEISCALSPDHINSFTHVFKYKSYGVSHLIEVQRNSKRVLVFTDSPNFSQN